MVEPEAIDDFKKAFRAHLVEKLVLSLALKERVSSGGLSMLESERSLRKWVREQGKIAGRAFGKHFGEPGMTALYAEAATEAADDMRKLVRELAEGMRKP